MSLPHSLFARKLAKKKKKTKKAFAHQLPVASCSSVHILFCSVIPRGMKVVFCLPVSLTSSSGLKPLVASARFSCALVCSVVLGSYILCPGLNHLFPFDCQEQTQIFKLCWSFPAP